MSEPHWSKTADPISNSPVEWDTFVLELSQFGTGILNANFSSALAVTAGICHQQLSRCDEGNRFSCLSLLEGHLVKGLPHYDAQKQPSYEDACKVVIQEIFQLSEQIGFPLYRDQSVLRSTLEQIATKSITITFFGSYNTGKSTVLNALLHDEVLPTAALAQTSSLVKLKQVTRNGGQQLPRLIGSDGSAEVIGTEAVSMKLEEIDDDIKDKGYKVSQEYVVEVDIPCAACLKEPWSLMLVDTPGFDATPHQSLVESIKLGVKSSPAYVYCVEFDKIQSKTSQEHYAFLQEKCKDMFEQGRLLILVTRYDHNITSRKRLPDAKVKAVVCKEIERATGKHFPEDKVVLVSGTWALCARLLQTKPTDDPLVPELLKEAKRYIGYCSTVPSGQGEGVASLELPQHELARHIEDESGIKQVESWIDQIAAPATLARLRSQNFHGDCSRYIADAKVILSSTLNCFHNQHDELVKCFNVQLNTQQALVNIQEEFKQSSVAETSSVYTDLGVAYDQDAMAALEEVTSLLEDFKTRCDKIVAANNGRCTEADFKKELERCLQRVAGVLERTVFLHVSKCFSKFAGEFGYKLQLLVQTWQSYCSTQQPLSPGSLSWPTGVLRQTESVVDNLPNLSELVEALQFPRPRTFFQRLKWTLFRRPNRLNSEDVRANLSLVEESVTSTCKEFFDDAKEVFVMHFFDTGYCARVVGELDTRLSAVANAIARKDERMKMWQEVIEICDASTEVLKRWLDHFNELEDFLEETFPHKVTSSIKRASVRAAASPSKNTMLLRNDSVKTAKDTISGFRHRSRCRSETLPRASPRQKAADAWKTLSLPSVPFRQGPLAEGRQEQYKEWVKKKLVRDDVVQKHLNVDCDLAGDLNRKDFMSTCEAAAIRLKNFGQTTGYPPILCDYSNELFLKWKQVEQKMLQIGVIGATDAVIGLLWAFTADKFMPEDENEYVKGVRIGHANTAQRGGCLHDDPTVQCEKCPTLVEESKDGSVTVICKGTAGIQVTLRELNRREKAKIEDCPNIGENGSAKPTPRKLIKDSMNKGQNYTVETSCSLLMCSPPWCIHLVCQPDLGGFLTARKIPMIKLDASAILFAVPYSDGSVSINDKCLKDLVEQHETLLREPNRVAIVITNFEQCYEQCHKDGTSANDVFTRIVGYVRGKFDAHRIHIKEEVFLFVCEKWAYTARLLKNHPRNATALRDAGAALAVYNQATHSATDVKELKAIEVASTLLEASNIKAVENRIQTPMMTTCSSESAVRMKNSFAYALESAVQSLESHEDTLDICITNFQEQVSKTEEAVTLYQSQRQVLLDTATQDKAASVAYRSFSDCASRDIDAAKLIDTGTAECNRLFIRFEQDGVKGVLRPLSKFITDLLDGAKCFDQTKQCLQELTGKACDDMDLLRIKYCSAGSPSTSKNGAAAGNSKKDSHSEIGVHIAPWKVQLDTVLSVQNAVEALRKTNLESLCQHINAVGEAVALVSIHAASVDHALNIGLAAMYTNVPDIARQKAYKTYCTSVEEMVHSFDEEFSDSMQNQHQDMKEIANESSGWEAERGRIRTWQAHLKELKAVIVMQAEEFLREQANQHSKGQPETIKHIVI